MKHLSKSEHSGKTIVIKNNSGLLRHKVLLCDDWCDRVYGTSWTDILDIQGLAYSMRRKDKDLPFDNEVLVCYHEGIEYFVHISEVETDKIEISKLLFNPQWN